MKKFLKVIGLIMLVFFLGLTGWLAGAYIGGNYINNFTFGGVRGYEAAGLVGCILGGLLGIITAVWSLTKR